MPFPSPQVDPMFTIIPLIVGAGFLLVFGAIAWAMISAISQWMSDNAAPVETFEARIIAKRDKITRGTSTPNTSGATFHSYFATFEYSNGQRKEFGIKESDFGVLMEGDNGTLTFQGSRFNSFQRHN